MNDLSGRQNCVINYGNSIKQNFHKTLIFNTLNRYYSLKIRFIKKQNYGSKHIYTDTNTEKIKT